jgi:hypothetical protein
VPGRQCNRPIGLIAYEEATMKEHRFPAVAARSAAWVLALAAVAVVCNPGPALGADRMVLCEEFTNTG